MSSSLDRMSKLSDKQLAILNGELERGKKSVGVAYLLYIFLGGLGIHKFYLGKALWGIAYLLMTFVGWSTGGVGFLLAFGDQEAGGGVAVFGLILLALLGIFLFADLFTIPGQVRKRQEELKEKLLLDLERQNATTPERKGVYM